MFRDAGRRDARRLAWAGPGDSGQGMSCGRRQDELLTEQGTRLQARVSDGHGDEDRIQLASLQHRNQQLGLLLGEQQLEIREVPPDLREDIRQQIGAQGGEDTQPQLCQCARCLLGDHVDRFGAGQGLARLLSHPLPDRGQHERRGDTVDQDDAELFFEFADLYGQGRLRDPAGGGRCAETPLPGHRHEVLKVPQIHAWTVAAGVVSPVLPERIR